VAAGALLGALVLAQILLPRIAAGRISSRVGRYGHVISVHVSAWPAIKLLWGDADSVQVRAANLSLSPAQAAALLWEGRGAQKIDIGATRVTLGGLALQGAVMHKRGSTLSALARTTQAQAQAALPPGMRVRLLGSAGGQVEVAAGGLLFGVGATVRAVAMASNGTLVAHPVGPLLEGFQLTLFSDRHVYVEGVGASVQRSRPLTYLLSMRARLR
jgi:hypothetical protein